MMRIGPALLPPRRRPAGLALLLGACVTALLLAIALARASAPPPPRLMVQVVAADAVAREADADKAMAILRDTPGVRAAQRVDPATLARMVGAPAAGDASAPPLPALIEATLAPDADGAAIAHALAPVPHAAAQPPDPASPASPLHRLALLAVLIAGAAPVIAAIAAVRARLAAQGVTVDLLRELGAEDLRIAAGLFQGVALDIVAGFGGALATALLLLMAAGLLDKAMAGALAAGAGGTAALALLGGGGMAVLALARRP